MSNNEGLGTYNSGFLHKIRIRKYRGLNRIWWNKTVLSHWLDLGLWCPVHASIIWTEPILFDHEKIIMSFTMDFCLTDKKRRVFCVNSSKKSWYKAYEQFKKDVSKARRLVTVMWVIQESNVFFLIRLTKYTWTSQHRWLMNNNKQMRSPWHEFCCWCTKCVQTEWGLQDFYERTVLWQAWSKSWCGRLLKSTGIIAKNQDKATGHAEKTIISRGRLKEIVFLFPSHRTARRWGIFRWVF